MLLDIAVIGVPFVIAVIAVTIVCGVMSAEYRKKVKIANEKERAKEEETY